jgi:hypothetical protein
MSKARKRQVLAVTLLFVFVWQSASFAQSALATKTQVVMLGTGTPLPDPDRSGPSTAIVVNGTVFIVDAGTGVEMAVARELDFAPTSQPKAKQKPQLTQALLPGRGCERIAIGVGMDASPASVPRVRRSLRKI